ncbi:hypothetical protein [Roseiterribacter gracilis]|uniref:Uncharacterized protein n=1 Tax=Roseiterribacter gracilis TaxID=2812848 RepID=A0A8S8X912_9PROT|nr:hypothetical protein TMPK1_22100 [Rhodospirillales bacterium TMPK1]
MSTTTTIKPRAVARSPFAALAWLCLAIAIIGFSATYWVQLPRGTVIASPLLHLHAILTTGWLILLVLQTRWIVTGQVGKHRSWGVFGVALATALVVTGVAVAIESLRHRLGTPYEATARPFLIVPVSTVLEFGCFVTAALLMVRRPEVHKRLMLVATGTMLNAAAARFVFFALRGYAPGARPGIGESPPVGAAIVITALGLLPVFVGMVIDVRRRGRPHPAYACSIPILMSFAVLRVPLSQTAAWNDVVNWLLAFSELPHG